MPNEFRQDLVSGEWILLATDRAKRYMDSKSPKKVLGDKSKCPFEDPEANGNEVIKTYPNKEETDWLIKVSKNKYPAVLETAPDLLKKNGPFSVREARGSHEVVIFRNHEMHLHDFSQEEFAQIFKIYQERYAEIAARNLGKYIIIFHNKGGNAGASLVHPHSQIMSIPILPPDVKRSISGSEEFYKRNGKRIYDEIVGWEIQEKKRIVYENDFFVAFCPFVSKVPYEVRIFPKDSHAHFEKMPKELLPYLASAMKAVLYKIFKGLDDPDFNFFIHTAPLEGVETEPHDFYTWHVEILPRTPIAGGFELGSGIDGSSIDPDEAAALLREIKI